MGFVLNQFVLIGGSEELPVGDTNELRVSRSKTILTKCVQTIIACDQGWELDSSKNATDTDYSDIPPNSGNVYFPGLFLKNTISGCKLFISHFAASYIAYGIKNFNGSALCYYNAQYANLLGLCLSIIPEGSDEEFGDPNTRTFIPDSATRIFSTYYRESANYKEYGVFGVKPTAGTSYMYGFGVTPYTITVFANHDPNGGEKFDYYVPIFACGRVLGELIHPEDATIKARYGVVWFRKETYEFEGWATCVATSTGNFDSNSIYVPGTYGKESFSTGSICKSNGDWLLGGNPSNVNGGVTTFTYNWNILGNRMYSKSGTTRWSAIATCSQSNNNNLDTCGIVPGDGFKGFLDTDLFRAGRGNNQQTFDNGKFFMPEAACGLLVGVDLKLK